MTLAVSRYDPKFDTVIIYTGDPHDESDEIDNFNHHILDYDSATYKPASFELLLCARGYLELSHSRGYDAETDTLTFGNGLDRAEFAVANGDLVAHWGFAELDSEPEFYTPVAVQLRNASKHLAPVIAALSAE